MLKMQNVSERVSLMADESIAGSGPIARGLGPEKIQDRLRRLDELGHGGRGQRARIKLIFDVLDAIGKGRVEEPERTAAAVVKGIDRNLLLRRRAARRQTGEESEQHPFEAEGQPAELSAERPPAKRVQRVGPDRAMQRHLGRAVKVLSEHRLIYVATPKVASSTLKATLWRLGLGDPEAILPKQVHDTRYSPLKSPPELGFDELMQWVNRPEYRRVCFVRNPYSRLLSCYLNKIKGYEEADDRPGIHSYRAMVSKDGSTDAVTFEEFVEAVSGQTPMRMNPHWRVQTAHLLWDQISYDFVGRMEDFGAELERLGGFLGVEVKPYLDVRNKHQTGAKTALTEYYTPDLQRRVYALYETDFKTFGYSFELPSVSISG